MLHCRGGYFYAGHTDDLARRIGDHQSGLIPGFTAHHLPVGLVWSQEFSSRDEAKAAEKQIKGWSRAKKLALIRGDWERISALAKGKSGPSPSSGKTDCEDHEIFTQAEIKHNLTPNHGYPELFEGLSFSLVPHPDALPVALSKVDVRIRQADGSIMLRYEAEPSATIVCPPQSASKRTDGLWQTTCFELFIKDCEGQGYTEFNFSPSSQWAAYRFDAYREGMRKQPMNLDPLISKLDTGDFLILTATIDAQVLTHAGALALSAVIEETDGTKSYWALAHPPGKPDFHAPTCFALTLPPPERP
jgi:predicted GIY-YIG superfamily endonuclease